MSDFGILGLVNWRQKRGIRLETIADATKLSLRQLSAIEAGDFKKLPGGIYTISYIKQYARAIGFDEEDLLTFYKEQIGGPTAKPVDANRPKPPISRPLFQT